MPILTRYAIGKRMSFDTDILVKLVWSGCRVSHIPTQVVYADSIPSHFHVVKIMCAFHGCTRNIFGMLVRLPKLLARHLNRTA